MLLDVAPHFKGIDGKWEHHIRQSDIKTARQCLELHRLGLMGRVPKLETDVAIVGTACHEGIRHALSDKDASYDECLLVAANKLMELWNSPNLWQVAIKSLGEAMGYVKSCFFIWWNQVLPVVEDQFEIIGVERQFDVLIYEDVWRRVYATGTSDVWHETGILDWKFSTKDYRKDAWKLNRYDVQSTWYLWARDQIELTEGKTLDYADDSALLDFQFCRIHRETQEVQWVAIDPARTVANCRSLLTEVLSLCKLIEAKVSSWPLNASDWWCSPVWCPAWDQCRGKSEGDDPWGLLARKRKAAGLGG